MLSREMIAMCSVHVTDILRLIELHETETADNLIVVVGFVVSDTP